MLSFIPCYFSIADDEEKDDKERRDMVRLMIHHENVVAPEPVLQLPGPGPLEEPKDEENQEKPADQYETMASILQDLEAEDEENQEKPKKKED